MDEGRTADETEHTGSESASDERSEQPVGGRPCPRCERPMYSRHCKYVCPEHGVIFDCADTFY